MIIHISKTRSDIYLSRLQQVKTDQEKKLSKILKFYNYQFKKLLNYNYHQKYNFFSVQDKIINMIDNIYVNRIQKNKEEQVEMFKIQEMTFQELIQILKKSNYYMEKQNLVIQNNQLYNNIIEQKIIQSQKYMNYHQDCFDVIKLMQDINDICWIYYKDRHYQLKIVYNNFQNKD